MMYRTLIARSAHRLNGKDDNDSIGIRTMRPVTLIGALAALFISQSVLAQTYTQAINQLLAADATGTVGCDALVGDGERGDAGEPFDFGNELQEICSFVGAPPGAGNASSGSGASATARGVEVVMRRLKMAREAKGEERGGGASGDVMSAEIGKGLGIFATGGYERLNKNNTRFEDGYNSDIWRGVLGVDYQFTDRLVAGLAFQYSNFDGSYDDGGGFDTDSYGGLLFGTILPSERSFVDFAFGYARLDEDRKRDARYLNEASTLFGGRVKADFDTDEYNASFLAGYNFPYRNFTIGPRLGLAVVHLDKENYTEKGSTGLELAISGNDRTSVQSRVGAHGMMAISTTFGVIVPQFNLAWVHEFADDQRNVNARFVQDNRPNPTQFKFKREKPIRDFGEVSAGVSAVLRNGVQPFFNASTIINGRYSGFGVALGVRSEW